MWVKVRSDSFPMMYTFALGYFKSLQFGERSPMLWYLRSDGEWIDLFYDKNWFEMRSFD